jgi:hypothetical protein
MPAATARMGGSVSALRLSDSELAEVERLVEACSAEQRQEYDGKAVEPKSFSELVQQRRKNLELISD